MTFRNPIEQNAGLFSRTRTVVSVLFSFNFWDLPVCNIQAIRLCDFGLRGGCLNFRKFYRQSRMAMHTGLKCAALLLLIAPLGCRSQGELDLAERDMRLQENRIYKLQEYVQQYQQMLEDCHAENEALRKQIAASGRTPVAPSSPKPRTLRELLNNDNKPALEPAPVGPEFTLPVTPSIDLGTEFNPVTTPDLKPEPNENSIPNPPEFAPPPTTPPDELPEPDDLPEPPTGAALSQQATQLAIRQIRIASMPAGLQIIIEPRSASGGLARAPAGAKMSLLIVAAANEESHGRWDYTAEQTSAAYRTGFGADNGWRFEVPFNKSGQPAQRYKLYARLVLPDGSKLLAEREFDADAGASLEEIPSGDAGWFRSQRPIASLANKLGREARMALSGPQPRVRTRGANGNSGGTAPAWQPQPAGQSAGPPTVSTGPASNSAGGTAPAYAPSTAPSWNLSEIPTAPPTSTLAPETGAAPVAETATRPDRPGWAPYR